MTMVVVTTAAEQFPDLTQPHPHKQGAAQPRGQIPHFDIELNVLYHLYAKRKTYRQNTTRVLINLCNHILNIRKTYAATMYFERQ